VALVGFDVVVDEPLEDGREFGGTASGEILRGAYRRIVGTAHFAVDPFHAANARIVDLELAPTDDLGRVRFSADVSIATPADPALASGRLLTEVPNRGNTLIAGSFHRVPVLSPADRWRAGDGWLYDRGHTICSVGWQWDVTGDGLGLQAPEALTPAGERIHGEVIKEFRPDQATDRMQLLQLGQADVSYPVVSSSPARLIVRDYEDGPIAEISRNSWFLADAAGDKTRLLDHDHLPSGFIPGRVYQFIYETVGAPVVGVGMLAVRDLTTAIGCGDDASPVSAEFAYRYGFGVSQTGRFLRHFLYDGMNVDEKGRKAFDGLLVHIAGGQRGDFNHRHAQPTVASVPSFGQTFPFAGSATRDPFSGKTEGLFDRSAESLPRVFMTNTSWEYWRGDASLIHTAPDGAADIGEHPNVRTWLIAGTHHIGGLLIRGRQIKGLAGGLQTDVGLNVVQSAPVLRSALHNLDAWVSADVDPPSSRHPRLADGTAVTRAEVLARFAALPVPMPDPAKLPVVRQMDLGPDAAVGIGRFPAVEGKAYPSFVCDVDDDYNERAGIRLPDLTVPVGTHTGWVPRAKSIGGSDLAAIFAGFTLFFARTREEREAQGDPRRAITERYDSRDVYQSEVRSATERLVSERFILAEDVAWVVVNCMDRYDAAMADPE